MGVFTIAVIAIDRSSDNFTLSSLIGYVLASLCGLAAFWGTVCIAMTPLGAMTKLGGDNPSKLWMALTYVTSAFIGAALFLLLSIFWGHETDASSLRFL